jgi:hypothetical protein
MIKFGLNYKEKHLWQVKIRFLFTIFCYMPYIIDYNWCPNELIWNFFTLMCFILKQNHGCPFWIRLTPTMVHKSKMAPAEYCPHQNQFPTEESYVRCILQLIRGNVKSSNVTLCNNCPRLMSPNLVTEQGHRPCPSPHKIWCLSALLSTSKSISNIRGILMMHFATEEMQCKRLKCNIVQQLARLRPHPRLLSPSLSPSEVAALARRSLGFDATSPPPSHPRPMFVEAATSPAESRRAWSPLMHTTPVKLLYFITPSHVQLTWMQMWDNSILWFILFL